MSKGDNMKITTGLKLLALTLIFVFIIGPTTASTGDKSSLLSGYQSSFGNSMIKPSTYDGINLSLNTNPKPAWVTSEKFCSTCALKNATKTWDSVLSDDVASVINKQYSKKFSGFFFGGAGGSGGAGGGGGCCG